MSAQNKVNLPKLQTAAKAGGAVSKHMTGKDALVPLRYSEHLFMHGDNITEKAKWLVLRKRGGITGFK
jgi:hypothetical protein